MNENESENEKLSFILFLQFFKLFLNLLPRLFHLLFVLFQCSMSFIAIILLLLYQFQYVTNKNIYRIKTKKKLYIGIIIFIIRIKTDP